MIGASAMPFFKGRRKSLSRPLDAEVIGRKVYLRRPKMSDYSQWSRLREESRSFLQPWEPSWPSDSLTKAAFRRRLRYYAADRRRGESLSLFIFCLESHQLLGGITLSNIRRGVAQMGSLGYWMGAPHAHRGLMSDALAAVIDYGFMTLRLHRLEAATLPENQASRRLLTKLGFVEEGYAKAYLQINGAWRDHVLFGLVRPEGPGGS